MQEIPVFFDALQSYRWCYGLPLRYPLRSLNKTAMRSLAMYAKAAGARTDYDLYLDEETKAEEQNLRVGFKAKLYEHFPLTFYRQNPASLIPSGPLSYARLLSYATDIESLTSYMRG
jgi:hypothetical protein